MAHKRNASFITLYFVGMLFLWPRPIIGFHLSEAEKVITIEIRYFAPEAGIVDLVWGIDDWQLVPQEFPNETSTVSEGQMVTPMEQIGETFVAQIHVPAGSSVQYVFRIKETAEGKSVEVWDKGRDPHRNSPVQPILIATYNKIFEIEAAVIPDDLDISDNDSPKEIEFIESGNENSAKAEKSGVMGILSQHWPLFLVGFLILLGVYIGFRNR